MDDGEEYRVRVGEYLEVGWLAGVWVEGGGVISK